MWEEIKPKNFHKTQVTIPFFFHVDLLLSHVQGVHPANILQASRKDVASIHTSLASCEHYDWSVLAVSILHARYVPKIRMRKHSARTNVRLQYACCTLAACMLRTRSTQAASFFFCSRHVRHFHKGCDSDRIIGVWPNIGIFTLHSYKKFCKNLWIFHHSSTVCLLFFDKNQLGFSPKVLPSTEPIVRLLKTSSHTFLVVKWLYGSLIWDSYNMLCVYGMRSNIYFSRIVTSWWRNNTHTACAHHM